MTKAALPRYIGDAVAAHAAYVQALDWWNRKVAADPDLPAMFLLWNNLDHVLATARKQSWGTGSKSALPSYATLSAALGPTFAKPYYGKGWALHHKWIGTNLTWLLRVVGAKPLFHVPFPTMAPPTVPESVRRELTRGPYGYVGEPKGSMSVEVRDKEWRAEGLLPDAVLRLQKETLPAESSGAKPKVVLSVYNLGFQQEFSRLPYARQVAMAERLSRRLDETYLGLVYLARALDDPRSPFNLVGIFNPRIITGGNSTGGAGAQQIFAVRKARFQRYFTADGHVRLPGPQARAADVIEVARKLDEMLAKAARLTAAWTAHGDLTSVERLVPSVFEKYVPAATLADFRELKTKRDVLGMANAMRSALIESARQTRAAAEWLGLGLSAFVVFASVLKFGADPKWDNAPELIKGLISAGKSANEVVDALIEAGAIDDDVARNLVVNPFMKGAFTVILGIWGLFDDAERVGQALDAGDDGQLVDAGVMTGCDAVQAVFSLASLGEATAAEAEGTLALMGPAGWIGLLVLIIWTAALVDYMRREEPLLVKYFEYSYFGKKWDDVRQGAKDVDPSDPSSMVFRWVFDSKPNYLRQAYALTALLTDSSLKLGRTDAKLFPGPRPPHWDGKDEVSVALSLPSLSDDVLDPLRVTLVGYDDQGTQVWHSEAPLPLFNAGELYDFAKNRPWLLDGGEWAKTWHCWLRWKGKGGGEFALPESVKYLEAVVSAPGTPAEFFAAESLKPDALEALPGTRVRAEV